MFGWPGSMIRKCIYAEGPREKRLPGLVYLLAIPPDTIARWIEGSCARQLGGAAGCFRTVLTCGKLNSGMMLAISGNVLENMDPTTWQNFFFRNGMTVSIGGQRNGTTTPIPLDQQEALARMADNQITSIPSGLTRFWRTRPRDSAALFPTSGAPTSLGTPAQRQKWLDLVKAEILA